MRRVLRNVNRRIHRRHFTRSIRPTDVFVVSYPKSGTTWLAMMLAHYLYPETKIDFSTYEQFVPDINDLYYGGGTLEPYAHLPDPRFFVVHATRDNAFPSIVYLLRDPRDVIVSYYHFWKQGTPGTTFSLFDYFVSVKRFPCEWHEHVEGWLLPEPPSGLIAIKYEEVHRDPGAALRTAISHGSLPIETKRVVEAVNASSFDRMKKLEETWRERHVDEARAKSEERFVRKGRVGAWREELDERTLMAVERRSITAMQHVGYEPVSEGPD